MKTTLTLDEDVATLLDRAREQQDRRLQEVVNGALRRALRQLVGTAQQPSRPYTTPSVSVGGCFIDNVDDIAAVLASGEGEDFK